MSLPRAFARAAATALRAGTALPALLLGGIACAAPPVAQVRPVPDTYGQVTLIDSYRWMEAGGAEFSQYLQQYGAETRGLLVRVADRAAIAAEIARASANGPEIDRLVPDGEQIFYTRRAPGTDVARLYMRNATGGRETLLVDPEALPDARQGDAIVDFAPSPDGNYVAYVLRAKGPETAEIRVVDVARRVTLADRLPGAAWAAISWRLDGTAFAFTQAVDDPGSPAHLAVRLHRLGATPDHDQTLLDGAHLPFPFRGAPNAYPRLVLPPGSDYALAVVSDGVSADLTIYAARVGELAQVPAPWMPVAPQGSGVRQVSVSRAIAFMLSERDAPRGQVLTRDLADPDPLATRTVLPQAEGVITGIAAASDALYVARREGGTAKLLRLDYNDTHAEEVVLPFAGGVAAGSSMPGAPPALIAEPRADGAYVALEGWVHPAAWMRYDRRTLRVADLGLSQQAAPLSAPIRLDEVTARAADGTAVPISLVARADLPAGPHPLLLEAYGAYGYSYDARFLPDTLPWVERGGVFAVAHVRGGGEGGEPWRLAGSGPNRMVAVNDLLACARALTTAHLTDADHLVLRGRGAGVLTVAPAMLAAPNLFRAVILSGGMLNPLRATTLPENALFTAEFGSAKDPARLPWLLKFDPYANITEGAAYPATLIEGTEGDPTEPAWTQAKFAARLQAATLGGRPVLLSIASARGRAADAAARADEVAFALWQTGAKALVQETAAAAPEQKVRKRKKK